jgi:DNA topoisomerase-3
MERGRLARETFMDEIAEVTRRIVERAKNYQSDTVPGDYATLAAPCPKCGGTVQENYKRFACTQCDFSITKIPGGRQLEVDEAEQLLAQRTLGPLQGFRSRLGRPFAAILKITDEHRLEFDFGASREDDEAGAEVVDFSDRTALGACPKCGSGVFDHGLSYVCEKSVGPARSCDFRSGKIILQQEIAPEQMGKLLGEGRTDLLQGFVSQRTRRKFKAFLVRGADGRIGFEFTPRPGRAAASGEADGEGDETAGSRPAKAASTKAGPAKKAPAKKAPAKAAPATIARAKTASPKTGATSTAGAKRAATKAASAGPGASRTTTARGTTARRKPG